MMSTNPFSSNPRKSLATFALTGVLRGYSSEQIAEEWMRRAEFDKRDDITPQEMLDEVARRAEWDTNPY